MDQGNLEAVLGTRDGHGRSTPELVINRGSTEEMERQPRALQRGLKNFFSSSGRENESQKGGAKREKSNSQDSIGCFSGFFVHRQRSNRSLRSADSKSGSIKQQERVSSHQSTASPPASKISQEINITISPPEISTSIPLRLELENGVKEDSKNITTVYESIPQLPIQSTSDYSAKTDTVCSTEGRTALSLSEGPLPRGHAPASPPLQSQYGPKRATSENLTISSKPTLLLSVEPTDGHSSHPGAVSSLHTGVTVPLVPLLEGSHARSFTSEAQHGVGDIISGGYEPTASPINSVYLPHEAPTTSDSIPRSPPLQEHWSGGTIYRKIDYTAPSQPVSLPLIGSANDYRTNLTTVRPLEGTVAHDFAFRTSPLPGGHMRDGGYQCPPDAELSAGAFASNIPADLMGHPLESLFAALLVAGLERSSLRNPIARRVVPRSTDPSPGHITEELDIECDECATPPSMEYTDICLGQPGVGLSPQITETRPLPEDPTHIPAPSVLDPSMEKAAMNVPELNNKALHEINSKYPTMRTVTDSEIEDYRLETQFRGDDVEHIVDRLENSKRVLEKSMWVQQRIIGKGAFGEVWLQKKGGGEELRAVKAVPSPKEGVSEWQALIKRRSQELQALITVKDYDHLFVKFLGWYKDKEKTFLAMEYIEGGDLSGYMSTDPSGAKADTKEITRQVLEGLEVLHAMKICHRDLKPQNILVASKNPLWVKITDFGISKAEIGTELKTRCGTDRYLAPELQGMVHGGCGQVAYTSALDIWSLGSMVHELLTSQTPFTTSTTNCESISVSGLATGLSTLIEVDTQSLFKYCSGNMGFPTEALEKSGVNAEGIAFVKTLLIATPDKRPSAKKILGNSWIQGYRCDWFEELKREFSCLGVDLDLGEGGMLIRQAAQEDIIRFLPTSEKRNLPSLLLEAIKKGYEWATSSLLKSQAMDDEAKGTSFKLAILNEEYDTMKELLRKKLNIGASIHGQPVLQWAAEAGHTDGAKLLLESEPSINTSTGCRTAFDLAVKWGHLDMVKLFIDSGFNAYANGADDENDRTPILEVAAEGGCARIFKLLLDIDTASMPEKKTALRTAVRSRHIEIVKLLLDNGTSVDDDDGEGDSNESDAGDDEHRTALEEAAGEGSIEICKLLLRHGANINARKGAALRSASAGGHSNIVNLLLDSGADLSQEVLHRAWLAAVVDSHIDTASLLLKKGCKIKVKGEKTLKLAAAEGDTETVERLLRQRRCVNEGELEVALMEAVAARHTGIVKKLVDDGADVNVDAGKIGGRTPLQVAVGSGCIDIVQFLLEKVADVDAPSEDDKTALHLAIDSRDKDIITLLLNNKADVNSIRGKAALVMAAENGNIDIVKLLLDSGADVNAIMDDQTALMTAVTRGYTDIVILLLEHGADINIETETCRTALTDALLSENINLAQLLFHKGARFTTDGRISTEQTYTLLKAVEGILGLVDIRLNEGGMGLRTTLPNILAAGPPLARFVDNGPEILQALGIKAMLDDDSDAKVFDMIYEVLGKLRDSDMWRQLRGR